MAGQPPQPAQTRRFRVKPRGAVVRAGASLTSAVVGELEGGTVIVATQLNAEELSRRHKGEYVNKVTIKSIHHVKPFAISHKNT